MPLNFAFESNVGVFRTVGDVEYEKGLKVLKKGLAAIVKRGEPHAVLFDLRESAERRTADEIRGIADVVKGETLSGRLALVADEDLYYGLSRMFESYAEYAGFDCLVFREYDPALDWLVQPS